MCFKILEVIIMYQKVIVTEVYSRVVGYYRPVSQWNAGKQNEFADRKEWSVDNAIICAENDI